MVAVVYLLSMSNSCNPLDSVHEIHTCEETIINSGLGINKICKLKKNDVNLDALNFQYIFTYFIIWEKN